MKKERDIDNYWVFKVIRIENACEGSKDENYYLWNRHKQKFVCLTNGYCVGFKTLDDVKKKLKKIEIAEKL